MSEPLDMRSPVVAHWPCRATDCRAPVGVTEAGLEAFETSNRLLRARHEAPLKTSEVMVCDACGVRLREHAARVATRNNQEMRTLIAELKAGAHWARADEICTRLEQLRHPDVTGLREAIAEPRKAKERRDHDY